ncbi:MAG: AraC family transcriptional regulator [Sphingomonas sp.]|uniref:AraC family transcriptional regulator n=1 Tax=Sphingomonas sp. TaxID=28214 RepID=UPI0017CDA029|nr:AraC family transcriptional regulator [Sphingomonas sp.]MBA3667391.1 AraC family transcriptional regulator [Sphingomonas sp.]
MPTKGGASPEWVRLHVGPGEHSPEIVHAHYIRHSFARHAHDTYVIGLVEKGIQAFTCNRQLHHTPAGQVFLINPGDAHTGQTGAASGYIYRTIYPSSELLRSVTEGLSARVHGQLPSFRLPVVGDQELSKRLSRFHRATALGQPLLQRETLMLDALTLLVGRYGDVAGLRSASRSAGPEVRRAREYLEAAYNQNVSLADLGAAVGLSPFHLARTFTAQVGIPPHAYQESVRARRARAMIAAGHRLADVALEVGYPDQSHLTRRFKLFVGMTPGQYARGRRIAQDRDS